jgi:hypothetical protein
MDLPKRPFVDILFVCLSFCRTDLLSFKGYPRIYFYDCSFFACFAERDPMNQMCQILNAHMDSIQWLDQTLHSIDGQLDEIEKMKKQVAAARTPGRLTFM